ncbi:hypothetical protein [Micromonospora sp. NPDC050276]|uniref:hypothetical protein n=1 Tax=Micromonospora sp. NPDC050276 TaxID=3364278 RepID=UPI0037ABC033
MTAVIGPARYGAEGRPERIDSALPRPPRAPMTFDNLELVMFKSLEICGPAVPTDTSHVAQLSLGIGHVETTSGPVGRWRQINLAASIAQCTAVWRSSTARSCCLEQADQQTDIDGLRLVYDGELRVSGMADMPGMGPTALIEANGYAIHQPYGGLPYGDDPPLASVPVTATAVPYAQWDNRDGGAMPVWLPHL